MKRIPETRDNANNSYWLNMFGGAVFVLLITALIKIKYKSTK